MITVKKFLSAAFTTEVAVSSESRNVVSQPTLKGVKNIVLIHGAFADGSSWSKVITKLQAKGYNVIAVQNPLTSVTDDAAAARRTIALMDGPVLLVAHSYGGMVMSEAGKDPKVAGLVYIAAMVPEDGQSGSDVQGSMASTGVEKEFKVSQDGFVFLSEKAIQENFVPDASPEEKQLMYATQIPLSFTAYGEKVHSPAWKTKPSWFIVAARDKIINPDLERYKAKLINANTIELDSCHVPMISQPSKVTDFIIKAAEQL